MLILGDGPFIYYLRLTHRFTAMTLVADEGVRRHLTDFLERLPGKARKKEKAKRKEEKVGDGRRMANEK